MSIDLGVKIAWAKMLLETDTTQLPDEDLLKYKWQVEITIELMRHNVGVCLSRKDVKSSMFLEARQSIMAMESKLQEIEKIIA